MIDEEQYKNTRRNPILLSISQQLSLLQLLTESGHPVPKTYKLFYEESKKLGFDDLIISKTWKRTKHKENILKKKTKIQGHLRKNTQVRKNTESDFIYISESDEELSSPLFKFSKQLQSKITSDTGRPKLLDKVDVSNASYTVRVDSSKFEIRKISDSTCLLRSGEISPIRYATKTLTDKLAVGVHPQIRLGLLRKSKQVTSCQFKESVMDKFKSMSKSDFDQFIKVERRLEKKEKRKLEDELQEKIRSRIIDVMIPRYYKNVIKC